MKKLVVLSALFFSASVLAGGTLTIDGSGYATGVTDFYWGDSDYYDVSFQNATVPPNNTYEALYEGQTPFFLDDPDGSDAAIEGIKALLNATTPPTETTNTRYDTIFIPFAVGPDTGCGSSQDRELDLRLRDIGHNDTEWERYGDLCSETDYDWSSVAQPNRFFFARFTFNRVRDTDGDGVKESLDQCPDTPSTETVDETGCPIRPQIPVPVMPWPALLLLAGFIGLFVVRKSRG